MLKRCMARVMWRRVGMYSFCSELVSCESKKQPLQLYGREFPFQLLPNTGVEWSLNKSLMSVWMRRFPSYLVWLVKKDDADGFYEVATYCQVTYAESSVSLVSLFRARVTSIAQVEDHLEEEGKPELCYLLTVQRIAEQTPSFNRNIIDALKYIKTALIALRNNNVVLPQFIDELSEILSNLNLILQITRLKAGDRKAMQAYLQEDEFEKRVVMVQKWLRQELSQFSFEMNVEKQLNEVYWRKMFEEQAHDMYKLVRQYHSKKSVKELFMEKCVADFHAKRPPEDIVALFEKEMDRFKTIDESSSEFTTARKYLEDLSRIPYGVSSNEELDLEHAQRVLDEEHYGLEEVKKSILEIIAVGKLKGSLHGKILCLSGGPGLGKTSIAKSIAKALKRQFYSIPLGGVVDSSVLKGHRRTYVGAYAGKIIEALKLCGTNNPVILLDEIDKMGSSSQGDPRSELLEILDPAQNNAFTDNYIDVPVDLSKVLFICSANYLSNVSKPLLDRMDRIHLDSYTEVQKLEILKRHLIKRAAAKTGVTNEQYTIQPNVLQTLVAEYSRHEGSVRQLERHSDRIFEKISYEIVNGEPVPIVVNVDNLSKFVGPSYYQRTDHTRAKIGVAISLSNADYTSRLTYVEAFKVAYSAGRTKKGVLFTGSLGKVFQEALKVSYSYVRVFLQSKCQNYVLFENQVHIHVPEGGSKKDGSTDSVSIAVALVSLATQCKVKDLLAFSGELTLQGRVLRTRAIKEKILVAKREHIREIVLPKENQNQVKQLSADIVEGLTFHFVRDFVEVSAIAFAK